MRASNRNRGRPEQSMLEEILTMHLGYEVEMLVSTYGAIVKTRPPREGDGYGLTVLNALIESFCIHARAIDEFLRNDVGVRARAFTGPNYKPRGIAPPLAAKINSESDQKSRARVI